jgi:surface antigen
LNNIKAVNVSCKTARSVALTWCKKGKVKGWKVSKHPPRGEVLLTKGREKVYGHPAG